MYLKLATSHNLSIYMGAILKDIQLTEATADEVVTVAEVKAYLQLEGTAYDAVLGTFITAARQLIEAMCSVSLFPKDAVVQIHNTGYKPIPLPYGPVTDVTEVQWKKCPSTWQVLTTDEYDVDGNYYKAINSSEVGLHQISYTLGVDERPIFQQAIKAQSGWMFNNRDSDKVSRIAPEVEMLLGNYRKIV